jgi:hypothetical protein
MGRQEQILDATVGAFVEEAVPKVACTAIEDYESRTIPGKCAPGLFEGWKQDLGRPFVE